MALVGWIITLHRKGCWMPGSATAHRLWGCRVLLLHAAPSLQPSPTCRMQSSWWPELAVAQHQRGVLPRGLAGIKLCLQ